MARLETIDIKFRLRAPVGTDLDKLIKELRAWDVCYYVERCVKNIVDDNFAMGGPFVERPAEGKAMDKR